MSGQPDGSAAGARPGTDYDPRLVDLYDQDNPDGADHDFFRSLAAEIGAQSIVDLGCGTGILTVTLATPGRNVVGIDPSATMLDYARRRPGGDQVNWVLGDSRAIPAAEVDYVVMSGNVAQHIPDPHWQRALADIAAALAPGGVLVFESRNPRARAWESWAADLSSVRDTMHGQLREWQEITEPQPGQVLMRAHNVFEATGEHVVQELLLFFREREVIAGQLEAAGFVLDGVWGDWARTPADASSPLMVFQARRR